MYSCSNGFVFQIGDAVVCHAHLLFKYGDPLGKVVVCADLAGQFFQLSVGYCLCGGHALFGAAGGCQGGDDHANNGATPGNQGTIASS